MTATQHFNAARQTVYRASASGITGLTELNSVQNNQLIQAVGLWNDVSNFNGLMGVDDASLARRSANLITVNETFLGVTYNTYTYWENALPTDWTRVLIGDLPNPDHIGLNVSYGSNGRYHEVYIDPSAEGLATFQLGSRANYTLIHEVGHSIVGGHITGDRTQTIMGVSESTATGIWYASTPMSLDIDQAASMYGANTTTRSGNDTYGFNASFSGAYRSALDFNVNTRPLVTIFDAGGIDTLDASGFVDSSGNSRAVSLDLNPGSSSSIIGRQTFAVIYRTSLIENAVGGGANDQISGNYANNNLSGGLGDDTLTGLGGNDALYGGAGIDTAAFSAARLSYQSLVNSDGSIQVTGIGAGAVDGADTLFDIEYLRFQDGTYDLFDLGLDDHRDSYGTTSRIETGNSISASLATRGDHDWFRINLEVGRTYRFDLAAQGANSGTLRDGFLALHSINGLVASDDDSGPAFDASLVYTANASATYFVDASAYGITDVGTYVLQARVNDRLSSRPDIYDGTAGHDWAEGLQGADRLFGQAGDDILDGGADSDWLEGGAGADSIIGGAGVDTASYERSTAAVNVNLLTGLGLSGDAQGDRLFEIENVVGSSYADTIIGDAGSNVLRGGLGADLLDGGDGEDTADYSDSSVGITIAVNGAGLYGAAEGDQLRSIENYIGSNFEDTIIIPFALSQSTLSYSKGNIVLYSPDNLRSVFSGFENYQFLDGSVNTNVRPTLVNNLFYYISNKDVWQAGVDAEAHYNTFGWYEGRDPNAYFSTTGYLAANPDVAASGVNPLSQYTLTGWREGHDPGAAFDNEAYLARNPDVAAAGVNPLAHYIQFGQAEGRATFAAVGRPVEIRGGFDAEYYLLANTDVARAASAAGSDTFAFARQHFDDFGWREGRDPNAIFDTRGYLAAYADIARAGVNPLDHYDFFGWREGRDPATDFDTTAYRDANPDVAQAGVSPMQHFLQFGLVENRTVLNDGTFGLGMIG